MGDLRKKCELCGSKAYVYCESDSAYLCKECDGRVHGANFLVARHLRTVVCCGCYDASANVYSGSSPPSSYHVCTSCSHSFLKKNKPAEIMRVRRGYTLKREMMRRCRLFGFKNPRSHVLAMKIFRRLLVRSTRLKRTRKVIKERMLSTLLMASLVCEEHQVSSRLLSKSRDIHSTLFRVISRCSSRARVSPHVDKLYLSEDSD